MNPIVYPLSFLDIEGAYQSATMNLPVLTAAHTIGIQPTSGFPSDVTSDAPQFVSHIQDLQTAVATYARTHEVHVTQLGADLAAFGILWASEFSTTPTDSSELQKRLELLASFVSGYLSNSISIANDLTQYLTSSVRTAVKAVESDWTAICDSSSHSEQDARALQLKISSLQQDIQQQLQTIATRCDAAEGGMFDMLVGSVKMIAGDKESGKAVVTGAFTAISNADTSQAFAKINQDSDELSTAMESYSKLSSALATAGVYSGCAATFTDAIRTAASIASLLSISWNTLLSNLEANVSSLHSGKTTYTDFSDMIQVSGTIWADITAFANKAQTWKLDTANAKDVDLSSGGSQFIGGTS